MKLFTDFLNKLNYGKLCSVSQYSLSSFSLLMSLLKEYTDKNLLIFTPDRETGFAIKRDIEVFSKQNNVKCFDVSKFYPFSHIIKEKRYATEVTSLLYTLLTGSNKIIILPCSLILNRFASPKHITDNIITLKKGDTIDREILSCMLLEYGYENEYILSNPGEFSLRGDIVDIFIPVYDYPVRLTLWDDYVESVDFFNIETQRRYKNMKTEQVTVIPIGGFLFSDNNIDKVSIHLKTEKEREIKEILQLKNFDINIAMCAGLLDKSTVSIYDYLKLNDFITVAYNYAEIENRLGKYEDSLKEHFSEINDEGIRFVDYDNYFFQYKELPLIDKNIQVIFDEINIQENNREQFFMDCSEYGFLNKQMTQLEKKHFEPLIREIENNGLSRLTTVMLFSDSVRMDNIRNILNDNKIAVESSDKSVNELIISRKRKNFLLKGNIDNGFKSGFLNISIITEKDIFGKSRKIRKTAGVRQPSLKRFSELKEGDYVVHIEHGIGIFKGLKNLIIADVTREFILLEYLNGDKLYVPVDKFNLIQKYVGEDGYLPTVDRLGGERWISVREKVKHAVELVAKELLDLYASRKIIKGVSFAGNEELIEEFGDKWEYDATDDQVNAIEDIFNDMDREYPMDRLLCGDVGYGKTEVAIRAILKAVFAGYQVAFLVPTTILTLQHHTTLKERFKEYPITVAKISRFESKKEQGEILKQVENGKIDILIGTHRLLQKDVKWSNLGLLIIDEEHKFGVKHKERIQLIKKNLDVLSMTATPIPRTLQMACLGVKDLSLINTPPADRQSIDTKIIRFDKKIIKQAVIKEVERGGQVYFVHNHIGSIYQMSEMLKEIIPNLKIAVAYGQMDKSDLEIIYKDFIDGRYNLLLSTTIIESGLDNPNVNTIFVNRADRFGISQLYQLRGRVGRSNRKAYCYFIIPARESISSVALKRLKVLQTYSGLSEGFRLAMSDLEIRGAGNLFGEKQSGHILSVGFEFYMDMLEDAVKKLKGEIKEEEVEPEINYNINAYVPESYIIDEKERLYVYKKLSLANCFDKLDEAVDEIEDMFGKAPEELINLTIILRFKILLKKYSIVKADIQDKAVILTLNEKSKIDPLKIVEILKENSPRISMLNENAMKIYFKSNTLQEKFYELRENLEKLGA